MSTSLFKSPFAFPRAALLVGAAVAASSVLAACGSPSASQPAGGGDPPAATGQPAVPTSAPAATAPSATAPSATAPNATAPAPAAPTAAAPSVTRPAGVPSKPATAPSSGADGSLAACRSASLAMTIDPGQSSGAAGSTYYPLNFTNRSTKACEMYGYPGVSFVSAGTGAGKQVGAAALRGTAFAKLAVRLAPGRSAHAWLKVTVAANFPAATCDPVTADWLKVYPPGETVAGYVGQTFSACGSASAPLLTILPVRAGKGAVGVAP